MILFGKYVYNHPFFKNPTLLLMWQCQSWFRMIKSDKKKIYCHWQGFHLEVEARGSTQTIYSSTLDRFV